ncbi:hypothetical protein [Corynebacterium sp. HMSC29G08]|uniref:hypothetical protein n=1 Tax=Corynebacterium sp. HMSC29G08 TaxID=1581069 RepID=UPI000A46ED28|nr:hypothetical protein [Corynebacterium sp. HMSC29G08]
MSNLSNPQNTTPETPADELGKRPSKRRFPKSRVSQVMWFLIAMCVVAAAISAL